MWTPMVNPPPLFGPSISFGNCLAAPPSMDLRGVFTTVRQNSVRYALFV